MAIFMENEIKYKPLKNILDFLDNDKDMTIEEIKEELHEYGIDPKKSIEEIKKLIKEKINENKEIV